MYPLGLITDKDVEGLVKYTQLIAEKFPNLDMLEIGAWEGKSAVVIARELKEMKANIKLHSIDPHDGFRDYNHQSKPTYKMFCHNMKRYEVDSIVTCIRKKAAEVKWERLISFLFIDALHKYEDIKHDFEKFEPYVVDGGCIAIHDYFGIWKDIKKYVLKEVFPTGRFKKLERCGSALFLEKRHV
jgi:predicted O-methyltransferase YrrM